MITYEYTLYQSRRNRMVDRFYASSKTCVRVIMSMSSWGQVTVSGRVRSAELSTTVTSTPPAIY